MSLRRSKISHREVVERILSAWLSSLPDQSLDYFIGSAKNRTRKDQLTDDELVLACEARAVEEKSR